MGKMKKISVLLVVLVFLIGAENVVACNMTIPTTFLPVPASYCGLGVYDKSITIRNPDSGGGKGATFHYVWDSSKVIFTPQTSWRYNPATRVIYFVLDGNMGIPPYLGYTSDLTSLTVVANVPINQYGYYPSNSTWEQICSYVSSATPDVQLYNIATHEFCGHTSQLTVVINPQEGGNITSVPEGISCSGNICAGSFPQGTSVTLAANPNSGWLFVHWDDGTVCSPESLRTVVMDGDKTISAVFGQDIKKSGTVIFIDGIQIFQVLFDPLSIWPGKYSQYLVENIGDKYELFNKRNESIIPFIWANTMNDTEAVSRLSKLLESWTSVARITHGPLIVVSHSWGTLLAYLAITGNANIHVDKFITSGSPLNANALVSMYSNEWLEAFGLSSLPRPSNVDKWHNYWAKCDPISASIPIVDKNYKINTSYRDAWGIYPTCHGAYFEDDAVWSNILKDACKK